MRDAQHEEDGNKENGLEDADGRDIGGVLV